MVFGIALSSQLGMSVRFTMSRTPHRGADDAVLVVGLIERQAGASTLQRLGGLAAASPLLAFVFVVPAQSRGIPPFSGFIGKVALLEAALRTARYWRGCWWPAACHQPADALRGRPGVDQGVLALARRRPGRRPGGRDAAALLDDAEDIAFGDRTDVGRMPVGMLAPTGRSSWWADAVLAGPIFGYSDRAATEVLDRSSYISAVLGGTP